MPLQRSLDNRYEVRESLGRGGMAEVYLARDRVLDRDVALKVLNGYYAEDEEFVRRFRREARSAASLAHPNVVSIHDLGEVAGSGGEPTTYYIAMEYVKGVSLRGLLEREGRLCVADAVSVARQVAEGLGAAHARGIVHRDIKPHNILLPDPGEGSATGGSRGEVKVADFGIARAAGSEAVTGSGEVLGTAHYLSPEQVMGGEATSQSDLYSLGVVMYEALTGRRPYDADHPFGVAMQHVTGDLVPPKRLLPELPEALNSTVVRLLGKDPEERHRNADELVSELDAIPLFEGAAARAEPVGKRPRSALLVPLCALVALTAILWSVQQGFGLSGVARDYAGQVRQGVESVLDGGGESAPGSGGASPGDASPGDASPGDASPGDASPGDASSADPPEAPGSAAGESARPGGATREEREESSPRGGRSPADSPEAPPRTVPKADEPAEKDGGGAPAGESPAGERGGSLGEGASPAGDSGGAGSGGEDEVAYVPDLAGQTVEMARATLESTGFRVSGVVEESAATPAGIVLRTDPPSGSALTPGSGVTLVASSGPAESGGAPGGDGPGGGGGREPGDSGEGSGEGGAPDDEDLVTVPDVSGRQSEQAVMILESAGLRAEVRAAFGGEDSGTVVSIDPPAGSRVEEGTLVTLTVMDESPPAMAAEPGEPAEDQYPDQYEEDQPAP